MTKNKPRALTRLSLKDVRALETVMCEAADGSMAKWLKFSEANERPARLVLPMGELTNQAIAGFVYSWKMNGRLRVLGADEPVTGLNAQGLEGFVEIGTTILGALLVTQELSDHHFILEA
jgi:hypothetical protein